MTQLNYDGWTQPNTLKSKSINSVNRTTLTSKPLFNVLTFDNPSSLPSSSSSTSIPWPPPPLFLSSSPHHQTYHILSNYICIKYSSSSKLQHPSSSTPSLKRDTIIQTIKLLNMFLLKLSFYVCMNTTHNYIAIPLPHIYIW